MPGGICHHTRRKSIQRSAFTRLVPDVPIHDVAIAQPVKQHGLVFMDTPGFDPCSATGQIAGGANVIMFTTGRGSMFGAKPVPSIKLATNTPMYLKLTEDMDVNWVEASLSFPTFPRFCGQTFLEREDKELADLCVKAYNDWMVEEWCDPAIGVNIPLCIIPLWDVELAAQEIQRNAAKPAASANAGCFSA